MENGNSIHPNLLIPIVYQKPTLHYINVPNRWDQSGLEAMGFGSYSLTVHTNNEIHLGLRIPDIFSAYHPYVNGELVATMSSSGTDKQSEAPGRNYNLASLAHVESDSLHIVTHISNFVHSKGGLGSTIIIGSLSHLIHKKFINDRI